jgi:hypothetical protein
MPTRGSLMHDLKALSRQGMLLMLTLVVTGVSCDVTAATIDTTPWDSTLFPFGEPSTAIYGQTITAPTTHNVLTSFTFFLDDSAGTPGATKFEAFVYAWDGAKATGAALFSGPPMTTTNNGGNDGFESIEIDTGMLTLEPGAAYILFFSACRLYDGIYDASISALRTDNPYPGGEFYYLGNGNDFSAVTRDPWIAINSPFYDLGFRATFIVPEPTSFVLLLGCGVLVILPHGCSSMGRLQSRWN